MYKKYKESLRTSAVTVHGALGFKRLLNNAVYSQDTVDTKSQGRAKDTKGDGASAEASQEEYIEDAREALKEIKHQQEAEQLLKENLHLAGTFLKGINCLKSINSSEPLAEQLKLFQDELFNITEENMSAVVEFLNAISFGKKIFKKYRSTLKALSMDHFVDDEENTGVEEEVGEDGYEDENEEYYGYVESEDQTDMEEWQDEEEQGETEGQGEEELGETEEGQDVDDQDVLGQEIEDQEVTEEGEEGGYEGETEGGQEEEDYGETVDGQEEEHQCESEEEFGVEDYLDVGAEDRQVTMEVLRCIRNLWGSLSENDKFSSKLAADGVLKVLVGDIETRSNDVDTKLVSNDSFTSTLATIFNIARQSSARDQFKEYQVVDKLKIFLDRPSVSYIVILTLALIIDDNQKDVITMTNATFHDIMKSARTAWKAKDKQYAGWRLRELLLALCGLAKNDVRKKLMVQRGVLTLICNVLMDENDHAKEEATKLLWELSFHEENKGVIEKNKPLMNAVKVLTSCPNKETVRAAQGVLWSIESHKSAAKTVSVNEKIEGHIMISYQWADQPVLIKVREELQKANFKTWMDLDDMEGSTMSAMAEAVDNAAVVLICMSEKYKESQNCRAEAEYTYKRKKPFIPLLMQRGYESTGWLGLMVGTRLFYEFSSKA
ncbi:unnamed protein product [Lymnaea stagnalis]|uniref:TIR domain-containing protein n=1 Tax=Lymnaea stagnalis TaxID=6523 RepID=A0AAV2HSU4_LYMST